MADSSRNRRRIGRRRVVAGATIADLDPDAVAFARRQYRAEASAAGRRGRLLGRHHLPQQGQGLYRRQGHSRTALLLLGKPESAHFLSPAQARITWVLAGRNRTGEGLPALRSAVDPGRRPRAAKDSQSHRPATAQRDAVSTRGDAIRPVGDARNPAQLHRPSGLHAGRAHQRGGDAGHPAVHEPGLVHSRHGGRDDPERRAARDLPESVSGAGDGEPQHDRHHRQRHQANVHAPAASAVSPCRITSWTIRKRWRSGSPARCWTRTTPGCC